MKLTERYRTPAEQAVFAPEPRRSLAEVIFDMKYRDEDMGVCTISPHILGAEYQAWKKSQEGK